MMNKTLLASVFCIGLGMVTGLASFAGAQSLPPYAAPPAYGQQQRADSSADQRADQMSPQTLADMLRSATTFHEMVRGLNLNRALGPDLHAIGTDGRFHHSVQRTAETVGAGAGVGAAVGAMSRKENGVLIGALVGGFGGLIIDQIMKHREEARERTAYGSDPAYGSYPRDGSNFGRGLEPGHDRDHDGDNDRDRREFKSRESK